MREAMVLEAGHLKCSQTGLLVPLWRMFCVQEASSFFGGSATTVFSTVFEISQHCHFDVAQ